MQNDRIRLKSLLGKVMTPEEAALFIKDGMTVGMSGFTRAREAKAVPLALAERAAHEEFKITLMTGASLGNDLDKILTRSGVLARRLPFQSDPVLRRAINSGEVMFIDQHLSETVELLRSRQLGPVNIAVLEAVAITPEGGIIPTTSVGNSATFGILAEKVIVEINLRQPLALRVSTTFISQLGDHSANRFRSSNRRAVSGCLLFQSIQTRSSQSLSRRSSTRPP